MKYKELSKELLLAKANELDELLAISEKEIEALTVQVNGLENDPGAQAEQIQTLQSQLEEMREAIETEVAAKNELIEKLNELVAEHEEEVKSLEAQHEEEVKSLEAINDELQKQLAEADEEIAAAGDQSIVNHKGQFYVPVIHHFNHDGVQYTSADLKTNPQLVAELIEGNYGVLKKAN